jgi:hypothetical protein
MRTLTSREIGKPEHRRDWIRFPILLAIALIGATAGFTATGSIDPAVLLRDMAQTAGVHPFTGLVSNLGAFLWCSAAAICAFASAARYRAGHMAEGRFFLFAGLLSAALWIDDFFMIHDYMLPSALGGIIPFRVELVFLIPLGLAFAAFVVGYRRELLRTRYGILVAAVVLLGGSVVIDLFSDWLTTHLGPWRILAEDGFKWMGIVCWALYFTEAALQRVSRPA